jgi:predicted thioesterase
MDTHQYLSAGLNRQQKFTIALEHTASHIGSGMVKVLATPMMIAFMEITARTLLDEHLPKGYSSVGTHVDIRHLAPSPIGNTVTADVKIESVEGNKISLSVRVLDGETEVGTGSHQRFVIDVDRFIKRVAKT